MKESELTAYLEENAGLQLEELIDWLRIPSISSLAEHNGDMVINWPGTKSQISTSKIFCREKPYWRITEICCLEKRF